MLSGAITRAIGRAPIALKVSIHIVFGGTRTVITDGYRFVIFRREGWRFLPGSGLEIYAAPRTTDGATSS